VLGRSFKTSVYGLSEGDFLTGSLTALIWERLPFQTRYWEMMPFRDLSMINKQGFQILVIARTEILSAQM